MHGDLSQFQRERVLGKFRKKTSTILVVTDVASRGLDITGLSHVINFALPQDPEAYIHRVGRTGRAGKTGTAITFITPSEYRKLIYIQRIAKTDIKKSEIPDIQTIISTKKNRVKAAIEKTIEDSVENEYIDFAEALLSTHNPKEALAGVIKVAFESEFSKDSYTEIRSTSRSTSRSRDDRGPRGPRDRDSRGGGGRRDGKGFVDTKGQARLFIAKGRIDNMTPRKLVDLIEKTSRVHGKRVQGVDIYDKFSFVNVSFKDAESIIQAFRTSGGSQRSIVSMAK